MLELLQTIYSDPQVKWLVYLFVANVVCGIIASLRRGDFRLIALGDWLWNRLVPLIVGYGVGAALASVNPEIMWLKEVVWVSVTGVMVGYILSNLKDWGVGGLPDQIAGRRVEK